MGHGQSNIIFGSGATRSHLDCGRGRRRGAPGRLPAAHRLRGPAPPTPAGGRSPPPSPPGALTPSPSPARTTTGRATRPAPNTTTSPPP